MPEDELTSEDGFLDERLDLADLLSHVLDKGVVLKGEVMLAVADIDLVRLDLGVLLTAVETAVQRGGPGLTLGSAIGGGRLRGPPSSSPSSPPEPSSLIANTLSPDPAVRTVPLETVAESLPKRVNADPENIENGLARLVLTLIEVLRKVLEHQAVRRMEGGHLSDEEIERLGVALLRLNNRMQEMKSVFGLKDADLNIDLGPLGRIG